MDDAEVGRLIADTLRSYTEWVESSRSSETTRIKASMENNAHCGGDGDESLSFYSDAPESTASMPGITRFKDAIGIIPPDEKAAFVEACCQCPGLVRLESHPRMFLQRHDFNVLEAARGLAEYWTIRREIFGERAYRPLNMTGEGALNTEDIEALRSGFLMLLPPDNLGRPVLFTDFSRVGVISDETLLRTSFFMRCLLACRNVDAPKKGYVGIEIYNEDLKVMLERSVAKTLSTMIESSIPTFAKVNYVIEVEQWTVSQLAQSPPELTKLDFWKQMTPLVAASGFEIRQKMQKLHFDLSSVPEIIGGSWGKEFDSWFQGQMSVEPGISAMQGTSVVPHRVRISASGETKFQESDPELDVEVLIADLIEAIDLIPIEKKKAYLEAMAKCPFLVRTESNPVSFLRCECGDSVAAAYRLVKYWDTRKTYFKERAFNPMTFQRGGVFSDQDRQRLNKFSAVRVLPNDERERPVLWWDPTHNTGGQGVKLTLEERKKYWFYLFSIVTEEPGAQEEGILFVAVPNTAGRTNVAIQLAARSLRNTLLTCFPVKGLETRCVTITEESNEKYLSLFLNSLPRDAKVHVAQSRAEMCEELLSSSWLQKGGIPVEVGGLWGSKDDNAWRRSRNRLEEKQRAAFVFQPVPDSALPKPTVPLEDESVSLCTDFQETMNAALASLSNSAKASLAHAVMSCPDTVQNESDPLKYLEVENGNLPRAAIRLASYWELRQELFGHAAYLPLGSNFENVRTVQDSATEKEGRTKHLPDVDYHGRRVFFVDNVGDLTTKYWRREAFFMLAPLCFHQSQAQKPDAVLIFRTKPQASVPSNLKHVIHVMSQSFPLRITRLFLCVITGKTEEMLSASELSFLRLATLREVDKRLAEMTTVQFSSSDSDLAEVLSQSHGLNKKSLMDVFAAETTNTFVAEKIAHTDHGQTGYHACQPASNNSQPHDLQEQRQLKQEFQVHTLIKEAVGHLPFDERSDYEKAIARIPDLVQSESNPNKFLKFEQMNFHRTAQRLTRYWKQRCEAFKARSLQQLNQTGEGGLAKGDVANISSGYLAMLPNDLEGRNVLLHNSSRLMKKDTRSETRNMFYWANLLLQNEVTVEKGVVMIIILNGRFVSPQTTRILEVTHQCFPFCFCTIHLVSLEVSPEDKKNICGFISSLPGTEKTIVHMHNAVNALTMLQENGLRPDGLPELIGGTWSYEQFAIWQEQTIRKEWELPLGFLEDENSSYKAKAFSELNEDERAERKRRFNVLHSRRRRQRARLEQEVLVEHVSQLRQEQQNLMAENQRLVRLLKNAKAQTGWDTGQD